MSLGLSSCHTSGNNPDEKQLREEKIVRRAYLISRLLGRILIGLDSEFGEQFDKFDEVRTKRLMARCNQHK